MFRHINGLKLANSEMKNDVKKKSKMSPEKTKTNEIVLPFTKQNRKMGTIKQMNVKNRQKQTLKN